MNQIHVAKFGGTSMADYDAMMRCANILLADDNIRLVVLSASSGVTNQLVILSSVNCTEQQYQQILPNIYAHHRAILNQFSVEERVVLQLEALLLNLHGAVERIRQCHSLTLVDEILSFGERLSSLIFTELLKQQGVNCQWFDARNIMVTDNQYGCAQPDIEQIHNLAQSSLLPLCQSGIVITQGFIGTDGNGNTTTLGRGGSDYSAALFAEALDAKALQIWTDVNGIYTTDPRVTPAAFPIDEISFTEAAELSTFGAKVLHPSTLWPAIRRNINVFVGSSFAPQDGGTWIKNQVESKPSYRAIAVRNNQTLVTVSSLNMLHRHGFLAKVFAILATHKISVDLVTTSEVSVALTLDNVGTKQAQLTEQALVELHQLCDVKVETGLALVAVVGNQIERKPGVSSRIFNVLSPYNLRMICHGASNHNICFLVSQMAANDIVCSLHRELFE